MNPKKGELGVRRGYIQYMALRVRDRGLGLQLRQGKGATTVGAS